MELTAHADRHRTGRWHTGPVRGCTGVGVRRRGQRIRSRNRCRTMTSAPPPRLRDRPAPRPNPSAGTGRVGSIGRSSARSRSRPGVPVRRSLRRRCRRRSPNILVCARGFPDPVVGPAHQVDLAKLRKGFEHEVVAVVTLDPRNHRQQQIACPGLVGGERQTARLLQFVRDRHGCIISPPAVSYRPNRERRTRE